MNNDAGTAAAIAAVIEDAMLPASVPKNDFQLRAVPGETGSVRRL